MLLGGFSRERAGETLPLTEIAVRRTDEHHKHLCEEIYMKNENRNFTMEAVRQDRDKEERD
jgi:hypothetical protein